MKVFFWHIRRIESNAFSFVLCNILQQQRVEQRDIESKTILICIFLVSRSTGKRRKKNYFRKIENAFGIKLERPPSG